MKQAGFKLLLILTGVFLISCQDSQTIKLKQYQIQGRSLYLQHCSNCHQPEGQGLQRLYPPLANSDYLVNHLQGTICLIRNGISGEIDVNGRRYSGLMPGNPQLSTLQIAEITTYLYNSWGNSRGIITRKAVEEALESCE